MKYDDDMDDLEEPASPSAIKCHACGEGIVARDVRTCGDDFYCSPCYTRHKAVCQHSKVMLFSPIQLYRSQD